MRSVSTLFFLILLLCFSSVYGQTPCVHVSEMPLPTKPANKHSTTNAFVSIRLSVEFLAKGKIGNVRVLDSSPINDLNGLTVSAAKQIKFKPLSTNGRFTTSIREIEYIYTYSSQEWEIRAKSGICDESTPGLTDDEQDQLKLTAARFIRQWTTTHDLRPLIAKWFVPDFVPSFSDEYNDIISEKTFASLTQKDKRRFFVSQLNMTYVMAVIFLSEPESLQCSNPYSPECQAKNRQSILRVFTPQIFDRLEQRKKEHRILETKAEVLAEIDELDRLFSIALPVLKEKNLEQTKEFRQQFKRFEENSFLSFLIKVADKGLELKGLNGQIIISKEQLLFGVETPLLIRLDFVKQGKQFKIFNMGGGDGD